MPRSCQTNAGILTDTLWDEYEEFNTKTGKFSKNSRWNSPDVRAGNSHTWHKKYSLPHTKVLGWLACKVCSKQLGIGPSERSWGDVKHIKTDKRSHLGVESVEKRSILYLTARVAESRIRQKAMKKINAVGPGAMFGDEDFE